jgi:hypothetical protein
VKISDRQRAAADHTATAARLYARCNYGRSSLVLLPHHCTADFDAFILPDDSSTVAGIVEIKAREFLRTGGASYTRESFAREFDCRAMMTGHKFEALRHHARQYALPVYLLQFFVAENTIALQPLFDAAGKVLTEVELRTSLSAKTADGGQAERRNAFVLIDLNSHFNIRAGRSPAPREATQ